MLQHLYGNGTDKQNWRAFINTKLITGQSFNHTSFTDIKKLQIIDKQNTANSTITSLFTAAY